MYAYPGVTANFPTVFDAPNGAIGPLHRDGGFDTSLGSGVSGEYDADMFPDDDGILNIDPTSGNSNQDHNDDGVFFPLSLPECQTTSMSYEVTVGTSDEILRYSNAWIDFNQDGDWNDTGSCLDPISGLQVSIPEHVIDNQQLVLDVGSHPITSTFTSTNPGGDVWMRVSVSEEPFDTSGGGAGVETGFETGETEDYLLRPGSGSGYTP